MSRQTITLGGGCFWCIEAVYKRLDGVLDVTSGYAGGHTKNPSYEAVCSGTTGHAEVVRVAFDPDVVSLDEILRQFFRAHDPTTPNRQGNDVGTQYRSIVLYETDGQREAAERVRAEISAQTSRKVVTEIKPLDVFYEAEEYHQDYFDAHPNAGYCRLVIAPKLKKLGIPPIPV
jgi:peptide-methionine (S)-S-oxide reductase